MAISNPLIDDYTLKGAKGLLVNITGGKDLKLFESTRGGPFQFHSRYSASESKKLFSRPLRLDAHFGDAQLTPLFSLVIERQRIVI